ncbi:N-terminal phage integrase SAM-like domain-containing protein [Streptomyces sp. NPDC023838]|uniref:N-terminal phage integrase SAM-like domain-containing protein n=1 Tax=Streptomyces sp. NPDC023838 TaxID=3154325 RepID=UPI0033D4380E
MLVVLTWSPTANTARGASPSTSPPLTTAAPRCAGGGFSTQDTAEQALGRFLEGEAGGYNADPNQTVAAYLNTWLEAKALVLKPTTMARYRDYVRNDLIPAFGNLKLDQLAHRHIYAYVTSTATSPNRQHAKPSTPSTTPSPEPSKPATKRTVRRGCDHQATTSTGSARLCADSAPRATSLQRYGRPAPDRTRDHAATIMAPDTQKAALSSARERPPTCAKQSRDDRI